jgi:hypothetical protein
MLTTIIVTKNGFDKIRKEIEAKNESFKAEIMKLGDETSDKMISIIQENKKRPQNGEPTVLEDNLKVDKFDNKDTYGWQIGNISILDQVVKYWRAINWGSLHMIGKHLPSGIFQPGNPKPDSDNFRDGRWVKGEGGYSPIVKNPIPAMHYIEQTKFFLENKLNDLLNK